MIWNPWKEIKRLREEVVKLNRDKDNLSAVIQEMNFEIVRDVDEIHRLLDRADKLNIALQDVIAEEKPTSTATVKRMAAIAREGLKQ